MDKHFYDIDEATDYFREHTEDILNQITEPAKKRGYVCNLCGNGTGKKGDGLIFNPKTRDGKGLICFKGTCGFSGDIIDYVGKVYDIGSNEFMKQLRKCGELLGFNVIIDSHQKSQKMDYQTRKPSQKQTMKEEKHSKSEKVENEIDYTDFFLKANKNIKKTEYHRGITLETLNKYKIGYCEKWKHPKSPNSMPSPRLIIPTSKYSYDARDTRINLTELQKEYSKQKVGKTHVFNNRAFKESQKPIYVVEAPIDALSIIDVGGEAVAMGSALFVNIFMTEISQNRPKQPLIIALDNDASGEENTEKLKEALNDRRIDYYTYSPAGNCKDPNEALNKNRKKFAEAVKFGEDRKAAEQYTYRKRSAYYRLPEFMDGIADSVNTPAQSTGFKRLDDALNGGMRKGLYLIGAITSLGKTTLALQMADQIAQTGRDVLIFTLEMDAAELISKSISRQTFISEMKSCGKSRYAKTDIGISDGSLYKKYNQKERDLINKSIAAYGEYSKHIFYREGMGDIGVEDIRKEIAEYIKIYEKTPIVIIDYIQILKPEDVRATDKRIIDTIVSKLSRLAREFKLPILGISSFNRENYTNKVTFKAFKESGNIEYSGDVVMGLQFHGAGEDNFDDTEAKRKNPREVELIILKARKARVGAVIKFKYNAFYNYFEEVDDF